jgi:hypothetical protein
VLPLPLLVLVLLLLLVLALVLFLLLVPPPMLPPTLPLLLAPCVNILVTLSLPQP